MNKKSLLPFFLAMCMSSNKDYGRVFEKTEEDYSKEIDYINKQYELIKRKKCKLSGNERYKLLVRRKFFISKGLIKETQIIKQ